MVTQLQPDVRAYLHGAEVIKRYIRVEEVAREYGLSVEETEYIASLMDRKMKGEKLDGNLVKGRKRSGGSLLCADRSEA